MFLLRFTFNSTDVEFHLISLSSLNYIITILIKKLMNVRSIRINMCQLNLHCEIDKGAKKDDINCN